MFRPNMIIAALLIAAQAGFAASPKSSMKTLSKRYKDVKTLRAEFRELFEWEVTGETVVREGTLIVTDDNRFHIETPEQILASDGKDIYRFNRVKAQVIVEAASESGDSPLPRRMMLDFVDEFDAVEAVDLSVEGSPGFRLELTPKDAEKSLLSKATLWATSDDMTVHRMKIVDLNGNSTTYFFKRLIFDTPVSREETSFTPPEGVDVIDLRY